MRRNLSDAEHYIMQQFWAHGHMLREDVAVLVAEKNWKPTTLLTFLSRLVAKGMLTVEKHGKINHYTPIMDEAEYKRLEGKAFLDTQYAGSARDFIATMVDTKGLAQKDVDDLRNWLNDLGKK